MSLYLVGDGEAAAMTEHFVDPAPDVTLAALARAPRAGRPAQHPARDLLDRLVTASIARVQ